MVSAPLRDRFGSVWRLEYYDVDDMEVIVERSARILDADHDADGVAEIARRSRGTPPGWPIDCSSAPGDYALVRADNRITGTVARAALEQLNVDPLGLDQSDHRLLSAIIDKFDGGPGRAGDAVRGAQRRLRHDNGRVGTLPAAAGIPRPDGPADG